MVELQNCRMSGRHTRVVRGKRGILAGFREKGRAGGTGNGERGTGKSVSRQALPPWLPQFHLQPDPQFLRNQTFPALDQRIGGNPPIPPMPFIAPRICRSRPLLPPLPSLDIIFSICMYCFSTRLTSAG